MVSAHQPIVEITETERPLPPGPDAHPQREIWRLLRQQDQALRAERAEAAKEMVAARQRLVSVVVDVARALDELTTFVTNNAAAIEAAGLGLVLGIEKLFAESIRRAGGDLIRPLGEPYDADVASWVDVRESAYVEGVDRITVHELLSVGVRLDGEVVLRPSVKLSVPFPTARALSPTDLEEPPAQPEQEMNAP